MSTYQRRKERARLVALMMIEDNRDGQYERATKDKLQKALERLAKRNGLTRELKHRGAI